MLQEIPGFYVPFETFFWLAAFAAGVISVVVLAVIAVYVLLFKHKRDPRFDLGNAMVMQMAAQQSQVVLSGLIRLFNNLDMRLSAEGIAAEIPRRIEVESMLRGGDIEALNRRIADLKGQLPEPEKEEPT